MKVYFISGLAADKRVFLHIQLPAGYDAVYLDWITPEKNESLAHYALRLAGNIDTSEPFVLVGLSMGGMLAVEIAKQYKPAAVVLISSIPVSAHLPVYFRWAAKIRIHKVIPISLLKKSAAAKRFITNEKSADKKLLWQIINESDPKLIRWSLEAILNWHNEVIPAPICHIHGTRDEILPVRFTTPTHTIHRAGHMLVMSRPEAINKILEEVLVSAISA